MSLDVVRARAETPGCAQVVRFNNAGASLPPTPMLAAVQARLQVKGINVSVSTAASTRLDMAARDLRVLLRASVHYYNTEEEVDRLCRVLAAMDG